MKKTRDIIFSRFSLIHPDNKAIGKGLVRVGVFVFLARFLGGIKEIILAWRLGAGSEIDAYLFVFNFLILPVSIWYSVGSNVLIPIFVRLKDSSKTELEIFRSELYGTLLTASVLISIMSFGILRSKGFLCQFGGLPDLTAGLAIKMVLPLSLIIPLGFFSSIFSVETMAQKRHTNTLLESIPPLAIIFSLVVFFQKPLQALVFGTVIGFFFQAFFLGALLKGHYDLPFPRLSFKSTAWQLFFKAMGIMLIGQIIQAITGVIDQLYAARMGAGVISELGYAQRIIGLALTLGATAISRAALPVLSDMIVGEEKRRCRMVNQWGWILFLSGVFVSLISWPIAPFFVRLFFERGAFLPDNTIRVAALVQWGLIQLPFFLSGLVFVAQVAAFRRYEFLTLIAVVSLVVKIFSNAVAIKYLGPSGIMLSTSIMYAVSTFLLILINKRLLKNEVFSKREWS